MSSGQSGLADLGWSTYFQSQLEPSELASSLPARVVAVHRDRLELLAPDFAASVPPFRRDEGDHGPATIGDWLLLERATRRPLRLLARKSLFKRKAAGLAQRMQAIAANIDTLFVVTSCNEEFNVARMERYLALALEAGVTPVAVLTKIDLAEDADLYAEKAQALAHELVVERVDARSAAACERLRPWCGRGQTVALVGSSGVGKSTLVNTLLNEAVQATGDIRESDAHGRHTTSARSLSRLPAGGWLLDTPGMRELQIADAQSGIEEVFADIVEVARDCRFRDCHHEAEPGCAVRAALDDERLDAARYRRYRKLASEDERNSESLRERRARERGFGRMTRRIMEEKQGRWRR